MKIWNSYEKDGKRSERGRLKVPTKFTDVLGDGLVVTKGLEGCLFVYLSKERKTIEQGNFYR